MPFDIEGQKAFQNFIDTFKLNEQQVDQFKLYLSLLLTARKQFNLTAISTIADTVDYHFKDSLALSAFMDLTKVTMIADVGTGGGFPGIPLKILFPHLAVVLIEVSSKKIDFLTDVIDQLKLENVEISSLDWRTFLRKARFPIDLFVARASLHTDQLLRMFQPSCYFQDATLAYWASRHWIMAKEEEQFFSKECDYLIQHKQRKIFLFKA